MTELWKSRNISWMWKIIYFLSFCIPVYCFFETFYFVSADLLTMREKSQFFSFFKEFITSALFVLLLEGRVIAVDRRTQKIAYFSMLRWISGRTYFVSWQGCSARVLPKGTWTMKYKKNSENKKRVKSV